ncbi:hypothetical protein BV898_19222 [Hypsibius exemplaris]|uniref:Uncharacterized protein n=1 Tax=Hypsibius exemplaris TaxID=2072580 RepID=A0A9X6RNV7_HYPEX|nr:hypothetical protein BV898_19222 [Hypsibius exemplaris]
MKAEAAKAQRDHVAAMTAKVNEFQKQINDAVIRAEDQYHEPCRRFPPDGMKIFQKVRQHLHRHRQLCRFSWSHGSADRTPCRSKGDYPNALNGMTGLVSTVSKREAVKETIDKISGFGGVVTAFGKMLGSSGDAASQKLRGLLDRAGAVGKTYEKPCRLRAMQANRPSGQMLLGKSTLC